MRKKLVILAMVALIALIAATPTVAAGNGRGHGGSGGNNQQFFSVLGTITAIGADTITVQVLEGSRLVWAAEYKVGDDLMVYVTDSTAFYEWWPDGRVPIDFDDLEEDDTTNIHGTVAGSVFTADRVTVDVECPY